MAEFLADIAGMLELFAFAAGLVLLHRAAKDVPAKLLTIAGWVLVVGGILGGFCTTYYWVVYQSQGVFERGYPTMMRGWMMHDHWMGPGMSGGMPRGMAPPARPQPQPAPPTQPSAPTP